MVPNTLWTKQCDRVISLRHPNVRVSPLSHSRILTSPLFRIAWPLDGDQPGIAAHLTLTLDVAFQLVEIRSGEEGLKPLYRGVTPAGTEEAVAAEARTIIRNARGSEGAKKRQNAELIKDRWRKEWEEGGDALMDLRRLLTDCTERK